LSKYVKRLVQEFSFVKGNLLVLVITWILMNFGGNLAFPYETPYIRALGASPFLIGILGSIGYITLFLFRIPGAYIADRFGRRQIIVLMTFGVAASYMFYVFAPDWRFILIGIIIQNICLIYQPALEAITADSIPSEKRGLGYALTMSVPNAVSIISPTIAGVVVTLYGLVEGMRLIYLSIVILYSIAALIRLLFLKETLHKYEKIKFENLKSVYSDAIKSIIEAWKTIPKELKILTIVIMISAFENPVFTQFAPLYVFDRIHITKFAWGIAMTSWIISVTLIGLPAGKLVDILGRKRSLIISYTIFIPFAFWFIYSKSLPELIIIFLLFGASSMMLNPAFSALSVDMTPREKRGRILGVIGNLNILAMVIASFIEGLLYQIDPSLPFYFIIFLGMTILVTILLFIREPEKREE